MLIRPVGTGERVPGPLLALVGAIVVIELALSAADRGLFGGIDWRRAALVYGAFWEPLLDGRLRPAFALQPYTMFLSHAFLHGGLLHVAMNGVILLSLGKFVAEQTGVWPLMLLLAAAAVGGGVGFGLLAEADAPMIGASGAVFGLLGLWQYWEATARRRMGLTLAPVLQTLAGLVVLNVLIAILVQGALAWQAHLGGFVAGAALGPVMTGFARRHRGG
ncbi:rhomboid family intramembrane serine protease [Rhodovulum sp. YNF3179]|uniref:rhomboid family intramembrane serine protease n=1 Tax=Rhodovulum sp. YNF3179 TaxID=3425127 RepID=UPI003D327140